jgi:hypothetical protein
MSIAAILKGIDQLKQNGCRMLYEKEDFKSDIEGNVNCCHPQRHRPAENRMDVACCMRRRTSIPITVQWKF